MLSQVLRGPEEQEYELKLMTSRTENSRVFVRFSLFGAGAPPEAMVESTAAMSRTTSRKIADLRDQATLLEKQIQDVKRRVDVGTSPGTEIPKLEVDLRRVNREIEDLTVRLAEQRAGRAGARGSTRNGPADAELDYRHELHHGRRRDGGGRNVTAQGRHQGHHCPAHGGSAAGDDRAAGIGSRLLALGFRKIFD